MIRCARSCISPPCLTLWERWLSEDGEGKLGKALSVTFGDSSPRGRAKGLYRYAPFTVLRPPKNQSVPVFAHNQNIMPLNRQKIRVIIWKKAERRLSLDQFGGALPKNDGNPGFPADSESRYPYHYFHAHHQHL